MTINSPRNAVITFTFENDDDNIIEKGFVTIVIGDFSPIPETEIGRIIITTTSEGTTTTSTLALKLAEEGNN